MALLVLITCRGIDEARGIAKKLLEKRLIACSNIVPDVDSLYWWKGKIKDDNESLLIAKTTEKMKQKLVKEVEKIHSYELPVIEFIETEMNHKAEKWIGKETGKA